MAGAPPLSAPSGSKYRTVRQWVAVPPGAGSGRSRTAEPASQTATAELVVPKSMPTKGAAGFMGHHPTDQVAIYKVPAPVYPGGALGDAGKTSPALRHRRRVVTGDGS